jgi:hypothetical protein
VSEPPPQGQLIAYVGDDRPEEYLFHGQPGVVVDVDPTADQVTVSLASGASLGLPATELTTIDIDGYHARAGRMRDGRHPTRDDRITPLDIGDPLDGPAHLATGQP